MTVIGLAGDSADFPGRTMIAATGCIARGLKGVQSRIEGVSMNSKAQQPDQIERYAERALALAKSDPQIAAMVPIEAFQLAARKQGTSFSDVIALFLNGYAERPMVGERAYEIARDPETGRNVRRHVLRYETRTYGEIRADVEALACALQNHPRHRLNVDEFVCILGFSGIDYLTIELATVYLQGVTVPLQSSLAGTDLGRIFEDTECKVLVATVGDLALAARQAVANGKIHSLIAIEYDPRDDEERAQFEAAQAEIDRAGARITLTPIRDLIAFGRSYTWKPLPPHPKGDDRMTSLMHSSGSTGTPKGAIIHERITKSVWQGSLKLVPMVGMCFAPMNHFMGRSSGFATFALGGTAYYTLKHDMSSLLDDVRLARPTFISFFPRVLELIWQHYQSEVVRRVSAGLGDNETVSRQVREEMRKSFLGDRVIGGSIGSAPTAPEVKQFIKDCFDIMLIEGYGTTEAGGGALIFEGKVLRPPVIDYKLDDVPELGYYSTDKPYPRGELLVKSSLAIPGYFKRPEATANLWDADGYQRTGDIMEERGPDELYYIDRRNDVLKLSQAEFVAVGPLGAAFEGGSPAIRQIYVYGNSVRSYLLAVVVPDMDVVRKMTGRPPEEAELRALIRSELQNVARVEKLRSFEIPRDFIIEMEPFSFENGLLTSVRKRMRPNLKRKYGDRLEALYAQIERRRFDELMALKNPNSGLSVLEKVGKALEASLGIENIDVAVPRTFAELGGDSIGAASFALFLQDIFGVELPVNAILSPAGNPQKWAKQIKAALEADHRHSVSFASVHGKGAKTIHAKDLDIAKFIDKATLGNVPSAEPPAQSRTVLLTGANGFLGHILCLEWMEQMAAVGGKVICLVRGSDDAAARRRLDDVFEGVDPVLEKHYKSLAGKHLEVLAADVAEARFGLSESEWDRLANTVERIVHPAALVNHVLTYEHLFGPNVFGTAELIRLALTKRQKRFDFVSSAAVNLYVDRTRGVNEDSPLLQSVTLSDDYAAGYGVSKWAGEALLLDAHNRFGLPVNIYRGDMMLAHRRYKGQINVPDMITRLFYSIIMTGLAPESFYEFEPDARKAKAHYDGLPVDFIAAAIVGSSSKAHRSIRTYNVQNHHSDDGVSLDSIVDWIESAGYVVERVPDHAQWLQRFETKLSTLTEQQRQHSSLSVLGAWRRPHPAHPPQDGCVHFIAAVKELSCGPEVPHITEQFIHKYLDDMLCLGLIGQPKAVPREAGGRSAHAA
jgi:fatty acid CoA ligase FadD9